MPSPLAVPPPWHLVSPLGIVYVVPDEPAMKTLANGDDALYKDLRKLVGLRIQSSDAKALPHTPWAAAELQPWTRKAKGFEFCTYSTFEAFPSKSALRAIRNRHHPFRTLFAEKGTECPSMPAAPGSRVE